MTISVRTETAEAVVAYPLRSKIAELLQSPQAKASIVPLLPRGVDYDQVIVECFRATTINPDILNCTQDSIFIAIGAAVQTGLLIGKTIHLVPVGDHGVKKLQAWTDYKGDIELVVRSGAAAFVDGQAVYEKDTFDYELGTNPWIKHVPAHDGARGRLKGFYAIAWITRSGSIKKITYRSVAEVEVVRTKSKQWNPNKVPLLPEWYGIKTAIHAVTKSIPRNPALAAALALFAHQERLDTEELDPAQRVEQSGMSDAGQAAPAEWEETTEPPSTDATPSAAWLFPLPFGKLAKGRPIGELTQQDLLTARAHAQAKGGFEAFLEASDNLLEERRERGL